jgi:hypothetical protein
VTHAAKYDYLELQAYRARLKNIFNVRGVVYTDADERLNRVRIAISPVLRKPRWCGSLAAPGSLARRWSSAHQSHFTRAFKRYTGLTPNAYRGSPRRGVREPNVVVISA